MTDIWTIEIEKENEVISGEIAAMTEAYILPIANDSTLGGVMPQKKNEKMNKAVGIDELGRLWTEECRQDLSGYATEEFVKTTVAGVELLPGPAGPKGDKGEPGQRGEAGQNGVDGTVPHIGDNGNWWIGEVDTGMPSRGADAPRDAVLYTSQALTPEQQFQARENIGAIKAPETAEVGQTLVVKEVDETGKPISWESADLSTGGIDWRLDAEVETTEQVSQISMNLTPIPKNAKRCGYRIFLYIPHPSEKIDERLTVYFSYFGSANQDTIFTGPATSNPGNYAFYTAEIHGYGTGAQGWYAFRGAGIANGLAHIMPVDIYNKKAINLVTKNGNLLPVGVKMRVEFYVMEDDV